MGPFDIMIIVFVVIVAIGVALYFLNKKFASQYTAQQKLLEQSKQSMQIFVIDKKRDKPSNTNLPKEVKEKIPAYAKHFKQNIVRAKVGPKIVTLMSERNVYDALPVKKTVTVDISGLYICGMRGLKSKKEMAEIRKKKKAASAPDKWYQKLNPKKLLKAK